jgi:hypothetical protein
MDIFPTPDSAFRKFAETAIDNPLKRKLFLSTLNFFGINGYAEKNRQKMISLAARGINPFNVRALPIGFGGIYPEFNFSILLERTKDPIAQRAAKLVVAALKYRQLLTNDSLRTETFGDDLLSDNHFGRVANLRKIGLKWHIDLKDCESSSHIVVAVNGAYYKIDVIDSSGAVMAVEKILQDITSILHLAAQEKTPASPYGVFTTNMASPSADIFHADKIDESIKTIDESIFLLAIDSIKTPADENEAAQDLHIRNYHNRDYRKSLQLVVLRNGFSGVTCNLLAGVAGIAPVKFASWIDSYANNMPQIIAEQNGEACLRLEFKTIGVDKFPLAKLEDRIAKFACDLPLIKRIDAIGKDGIKQLNVSPDAFFHAAAHLAYCEAFKRIPSVQSFADFRRAKFRSITRYLTTSDELVAFLRNPTKAALLKAFEAHRRTTQAIKSGDCPTYFALFYLYPWVGFKPLLGILVFLLFVPGFFKRRLSPDIWASNIPALPGIYCLGRFGIFFKMARRNCLAGHYLFFPDHIKICFPSHEKSFLDSWPFDRALNDAMIKLRHILS